MKVRCITDDLGLPIGTEFVLDDATGRQCIGWGIVEEVTSDTPPDAIEIPADDTPPEISDEELEKLTAPTDENY
jgi:hypothetical protein